MNLVTLTCPCGVQFQATEAGVRAGRKWCSGSCQDHRKEFNKKRKAYMREYGKKRRAVA